MDAVRTLHDGRRPRNASQRTRRAREWGDGHARRAGADELLAGYPHYFGPYVAGLLRTGRLRLLLAELVAQCEARGARQMLAVIGDSANAGSIGVHRACGFAHSGVLKAAGWKFGRWLDVVLMQRMLGEGDRTPAAG